MGKIIYETKGAAAEYAKYGFSAFLGCSCGCSYCFNKHGRFAKVMGGNVPTLKKCFRDERHALEVFEKELKANLSELQKHGLLFSFTTDPCLPETWPLTQRAGRFAIKNHVPIKILTKRAELSDFTLFNWFWGIWENDYYKKYVAVGFTLTGHDSLEPGASTNTERIEAMKKLHNAGFKTFASIEPIIDFESSFEMVRAIAGRCDLIKIGLMSGKKYDKGEQDKFMFNVIMLARRKNLRVYLKDSMFKNTSYLRENLPFEFVTADYNIFKN